MNYLDKIWDYKAQELESLIRRRSLADVRAAAADCEAPRSFYAAVAQNEAVRIIAEVKRASPSLGVIVADFDPVRLASLYEEGGARALSVLTDEHFFQGHLDHMNAIKAQVALPVLRKDFTLHEYHIYEGRAAGADAVLLIARMLEPAQLKDYAQLIRELGMTTLLEIHDEADLSKLQLDSVVPEEAQCLVGINNRDLSCFTVDLGTSEQLKPKIPQGFPVVAESGIARRADVERLQGAGIRIFLIGETLLKSDDMNDKLKELLGI